MLRPGARPIDFRLRAGEIVGLAGLEGHGQATFLLALRGQGGFGGAVLPTAGRVPLTSPRDAAKHGIAYVPRERRDEALFSALPIRGNFALPTLSADTTAGIVRWGSTDRRFRSWIDRLGIKLRLGRRTRSAP